MQIFAAGLAGALLPGLLGVMAENINLEIIPIFIMLLFVLLLTINNLIKKVKDSAARKAA